MNTPIQQGIKNLHRRAFLQRSTALGIAGAAAPWALNLAAMSDAVAASTVTDYKALVCVFLYGGNDYANTLVPYDTSNYNAYSSIRSTIAIAQNQLLPLSTNVALAGQLPSGRQMALAPTMTGLKTMWDTGKMGVMLNVGPLLAPTSLAQYNAKSVPLPPKLFSHNDQQSIWQSDQPEGATSGWGGRMGDMLYANNGNATFTCVNVSGNAVMMSGNTSVQYQVSSSGAVRLNAVAGNVYGSSSVSSALRTITQNASVNSSNLIEAEHARVMKRAVDAESSLSLALASSSTPALTTTFNTANSLAVQMQMVARMIAVRSALGVKRQVFFVSLGGFDHHDFLLNQHPGLIGNVSEAMKSFYDATVELGVANQVTAFTASDFGRTLSSNGDGSDHGWGSHHFVVGGAVQGQQYYGKLPATAVSGPDDVGQGRLLPSSSVDQYGGAMARWFGINTTDMASVFPDSGQFDLNALPIF